MMPISDVSLNVPTVTFRFPKLSTTTQQAAPAANADAGRPDRSRSPAQMPLPLADAAMTDDLNLSAELSRIIDDSNRRMVQETIEHREALLAQG